MEPIILIGPIGAGKSTIAELLAKQLSLPAYSLDEEAQQYAEPLGYKIDQWNIGKEENLFAAYEYRRSFYDEIVTRFLAAHDHGIYDFGGGHPIVPDAAKQKRIKEALEPYNNIFLLLPTPDLDESLKILRQRNELAEDEPDLNVLYFENKNRTFWEIAKHVIYTEGKTSEETCEEIIEKLE